ncbi:IS4 family transposase [Nonomuraea jabiensis]|uniref:Transposase IS4-like domain-containing protein n=1 Tax=Nonomuraea jabiensis TaxID=882448 RepID=A0A7W9FZS7_9ACTN|nr:IS4 family transposase [Nonomuraea jabiensis]MBB5774504.1 hypothetical protein [Nonomuraea jabiensis]
MFQRVRGVLAGSSTPGAHAFGLRLMAWDATTLDLPGSVGNIAAFDTRNGASCPQIRLMTVTECGTHAIADATFDGIDAASEQVLASRLTGALGPGMLLLADQNFRGHAMWQTARATGAHLLWRARTSTRLDRLTDLPDGSFLSVIPTPAEIRRRTRHAHRHPAKPLSPARDGHQVRVIDYSITIGNAGGHVRTEHLRLITSLLDPNLAPADQLAALYHQRWEAEGGYAELKTHLRGAGRVLRSHTPDGIRQEIYAFLIVYQALCTAEAHAAATAGLDPDRISFTITLRAARRSATVPTTWRDFAHHLLADLLPARRDRSYPRTATHIGTSRYARKKPSDPPPPGKIAYTLTITTKALN